MKSSEDDIFNQSMIRVKEITGMGTGAVEIKSGYGLNPGRRAEDAASDQKNQENSPLEVKSHLPGSSFIPGEFQKDKRDIYRSGNK